MHPHVKYELQELEKLVALGESAKDIPEKSRLASKKTIKTEVERIKRTLIYEVFNFEDERHLERYIQYHQQALIRLIDKVDLCMQIDTKKNVYFLPCYHAFEDLLSFVERYFTKYFDQDAKAPEGYLTAARKDARLNVKKIEKELAQRGADTRIVQLMLQVLKKIIDSSVDRGTTYRKVMYAKELQKEIFRLLARNEDDLDINEELRQIMYYLNYNSSKVVTYHAHYISALLDGTETRSEKIEHLSFVLKNVSQAQVKPGIGYNQHASSLKNQLSEYIAVEIEYHERLQRLTNRSGDPPSDNLLSGFKLKFEASVSQLAYLLKVLLETKIILNNNLSKILHFLVQFVITKRSENISYGSLRSKFYNVENGTKESVRTMLSTMIQYIDRN